MALPGLYHPVLGDTLSTPGSVEAFTWHPRIHQLLLDSEYQLEHEAQISAAIFLPCFISSLTDSSKIGLGQDHHLNNTAGSPGL